MKQFLFLAATWLLALPTLFTLSFFGRIIFVENVQSGDMSDIWSFVFLSIFTTPGLILMGKYWWRRLKASGEHP